MSSEYSVISPTAILFEIVRENEEIFYHNIKIYHDIDSKTVYSEDEASLKGLEIEPYFNAMRNSGTIIIIFTALALEGLINFYAKISSNPKYFNDDLEKLSPENKWIIFPKLFHDVEMDKSKEWFFILKKIYKKRNFYAHPKSKNFDYNFNDVNDVKKLKVLLQSELNDFIDLVKKCKKIRSLLINEIQKIHEKNSTIAISMFLYLKF